MLFIVWDIDQTYVNNIILYSMWNSPIFYSFICKHDTLIINDLNLT